MLEQIYATAINSVSNAATTVAVANNSVMNDQREAKAQMDAQTMSTTKQSADIIKRALLE